MDLTDYSMRLLEKKYDIDGHKEFYLSTVVFQYTQAEPEKKKLQAIQEAAAQAVKDSYADEPHAEAQVAMLIANQASDNDNKSLWSRCADSWPRTTRWPPSPLMTMWRKATCWNLPCTTSP